MTMPLAPAFRADLAICGSPHEPHTKTGVCGQYSQTPNLRIQVCSVRKEDDGRRGLFYRWFSPVVDADPHT